MQVKTDGEPPSALYASFTLEIGSAFCSAALVSYK